MFKYDLFLSYSTMPDYRLARDTERFIESFHELNLPLERKAKQLKVCRDGSEFILKTTGAKADTEEKRDEVWNTIEPHLADSKYLLLFACPQSAQSVWVRQEVEWFLQHRPENIWIAVTAGAENEIKAAFPPGIIERGIDRRIWFDFRAYHARQGGGSGTDKELEDEWVRLTANLHDLSSGNLWPIFERDKRQRAKRRARIATVLAVIGFSLAVVTGISTVLAVQRKRAVEQSEFNARQSLHRLLLEQSDRSHVSGQHEQSMLEKFKAEDAIPGQISVSTLLQTVVQGTSMLWDDASPFESLASQLVDAGSGQLIGLRHDGFGLWDAEGKLLQVIPLQDGQEEEKRTAKSSPVHFAVSAENKYIVWVRAYGAQTEYIFQSFAGLLLHIARPALNGRPLRMITAPTGMRCAIVTSDGTACLLDGPSGKILLSVNLQQSLRADGGDGSATPDDDPAPWAAGATDAQVILTHPSRTTVTFDWSGAAPPKIAQLPGPRLDQVHLSADRRTFYGMQTWRPTCVWRWPADHPELLEKIAIPDSIAPLRGGLSRICGFGAKRAVLFSGSGQYLLEGSDFRLVDGRNTITWAIDDVIWAPDAASFIYTQVPVVHLADHSDIAEEGRIQMALNPALKQSPEESRMVIRTTTTGEGKTIRTGLPWAVLAYSPDGRYLALGNAAGALQLRESITGKIVSEQVVADSPITCLAFAPDNSSRILVTTRGGDCLVRDSFSAAEVWRRSVWPVRLTAGAWHPTNGDIVCVGYRPTMVGETVAAGSGGVTGAETILTFDKHGTKQAGHSIQLGTLESGPRTVHYSSAGDRILVPTYENVDIFDTGLKFIGSHTFGNSRLAVRSTLISSQKGLLYACLADGRIFSCDPRGVTEAPREVLNLQSRISNVLEIGPNAFLALPQTRDLLAMYESIEAGGKLPVELFANTPVSNEPAFFDIDGRFGGARTRRVIGSRDIRAAGGSAFAGLYTIADGDGHLYTFNAIDTPEQHEVIPEQDHEAGKETPSTFSLSFAMTAPVGSSEAGVWFARIRAEVDQAELSRRAASGNGSPLRDGQTRASIVYRKPDGSSTAVAVGQTTAWPAPFIGSERQSLICGAPEDGGRLQMLDLGSGKTITEWDLPWSARGPFQAGFSPDGKRAFVLSLETGEMVVYRIDGDAVTEASRLLLKEVANVSLGYDPESTLALDLQGHLVRWNLKAPGQSPVKSARTFLSYASAPGDGGLWALAKDDPSQCFQLSADQLQELSSFRLGMPGEEIGVESTGQFLIASHSRAGRVVVDLATRQPLFQVPSLGRGLNEVYGVVRGRNLYLAQLSDRALSVDIARLRTMRSELLKASSRDLVTTGEAVLASTRRSFDGHTPLGRLLTEAQRESVASRIRQRVTAESPHLDAQHDGITTDRWLSLPDIYTWPHFTWTPAARSFAPPPKSQIDLESTMDKMWMTNPFPSGPDFEALKKSSQGRHPVVLAAEVAAALGTTTTDLFAVREKAQEAQKLLWDNPSPFLLMTRDVTLRQLAYIENQLLAVDRVAEYLPGIKLWLQSDYQMLYGVISEYKNLGRFDRAIAILNVVEKRVSDIRRDLPNQPFLQTVAEQCKVERQTIQILQEAAQKAPYLPAAVVSSIHPASPANGAGLQIGDLVYAIDGQALQSLDSFSTLDFVPRRKLKVWRSGSLLDIETSLQGVFVFPLQYDCIRAFVVQAVAENSPAEKAGIKRYDLLLRQGDQALDSGYALKRRLLDAQAPVPVTLFSPGAPPLQTKRNGDDISWGGETKTIEVPGGELGITVNPMYFSQPLLRDKEFPEKLGW